MTFKEVGKKSGMTTSASSPQNNTYAPSCKTIGQLRLSASIRRADVQLYPRMEITRFPLQNVPGRCCTTFPDPIKSLQAP